MDSLLTGEMSLLLWWFTAAGLEGEGDLTGICQEGIFGADGEGGNCLLVEEGEDGRVCPQQSCPSGMPTLVDGEQGQGQPIGDRRVPFPLSAICGPSAWGQAHPPWQLQESRPWGACHTPEPVPSGPHSSVQSLALGRAASKG